MSRSIYKELTKEMLKEMGITSITWDYQNNEWWINRYWRNAGKSTAKVHKRVTIQVSRCKHKYTQDKCYPIIVLSYHNKATALPLGRVIYAWFYDKVEEGMVIDHIDNDSFNNKLENLRMTTQKDNLSKRYLDNPFMNFNQYDALKAVSNENNSQSK